MTGTPSGTLAGVVCRFPGRLSVAVPLLAATVACQREREPLPARISRALPKAIEFLANSQRRTGEFPTLCWLDALPEQKLRAVTPFTAAQLLLSLRFVPPTPQVRRMEEAAVAFLLSQREPPGVWRFWKDKLYPVSPDADDTALVWAALGQRGHTAPRQAFELIEAGRTEFGLFASWLGVPASWLYVDEENWQADLVVNANVLYFFALAGEPAPGVCRQMVALTRSRYFVRGAPYYPSPLSYTYALSRAWADGGATCLADALPDVRAYALDTQRPDGDWGDDLETALGTLTLLNTGPRDAAAARGIEALLDRQKPDGGWALAPAYIGASVMPFGAAAWTTALSVEALAKYLKPPI